MNAKIENKVKNKLKFFRKIDVRKMKIINHQFLNFGLLKQPIKVNKTPKTILIPGNFIFIIVKSYVKK